MRKFLALIGMLAIVALSSVVLAAVITADSDSAKSVCKSLPNHADLQAALSSAQADIDGNGGFGFHMWVTVVDRDGMVCGVAFTGGDRGDQWPGSRVISAQKANTANAFSLPGLALSTANLFTAVQPGGSLFGLMESNPVDTSVGYGGNSGLNGTTNDPSGNGSPRTRPALHFKPEARQRLATRPGRG